MAVNDYTTWCPAIELKETETALILRAELPGVALADLNVRASQKSIAITGEHRYHPHTEEKELLASELHYGTLQCDIPLPVAIQTDQVRGELIDGLLTLTMPKIEQFARSN